jgi:hypothetical protein
MYLTAKLKYTRYSLPQSRIEPKVRSQRSQKKLNSRGQEAKIKIVFLDKNLSENLAPDPQGSDGAFAFTIKNHTFQWT